MIPVERGIYHLHLYQNSISNGWIKSIKKKLKANGYDIFNWKIEAEKDHIPPLKIVIVVIRK